MAQESAQLNKGLLKLLRNQKDETQSDTAQACFISERQYQNIERYGYTTTRVIKSIAAHFGISPKELSTNINEDSSLWYITNPGSKIGEIANVYYKTIEEIKSWAKTYGNNYEPQLTIIDNAQVKKISITFVDSELTWTIRLIELNEKIGLVWAELSDWQQESWEMTRNQLVYGCVEKVCLNGALLIPEGSVSKFIVEFIEYGQGKTIKTGQRIFNSAAEFRVSFSEWLETLSQYEPRHSQPGILFMTYDSNDDMTKAIRISKVCINKRGQITRAPWSATNIEDLKKTILDRKNGELKPLPIGIGQSFDGEEITPFGPDVTNREVTECQETDCSIEFE